MDFKDIQAQFMAHIRNPLNTSVPSDVEPRRMAIYSDLFFNNIEGFVASAFPVLKSLYEDKAWVTLVRQFFIEHDCETPYFLEISQEFIAFLSNEYQMKPSDPDFMLELAHYEWVELDISIRDQNEKELTFEVEYLESTALFLSSLSWSLSYQYPVHHISIDYQPENAPDEPSYIIVFRDSGDEVRFIAINAMTALMLQIITEHPGIIFETLCDQIHIQAQGLALNVIKQGAISVLISLAEKGILVTKI
ncbi:DNA-binding domain-containing protein [Pseudoalteromonas denitrificans]|uniref:HvfC family RiPP maturation protein n=1 Tax=Pseudoalteromonas denitrificans TaxID=43656 RepID=UPI000B8208CF|nr:putative DNA-binding domain-containing protein [Pseudoalteromonas denitrificans]